MTEQQTPDREKKIAEIRKSAEEARKSDRSWVDGQDYADDVEFLLDELELERAAHNAHVTELCELEKENRKLREELDDLIDGLLVYAEQRIGSDDDGEHARNILREIGVTVE